MSERHAQSRGVHRPQAGPVILDRGFRLFFLAAATWAALLMVVFILMWTGEPVFAPALSVIDWHAHELLFGYSGAVIAGFLLTAVPNWTKRFPVSGWRLVVLFALWLAGRIAIGYSDPLGPWPTAIIELAFPFGLAFVIAREVIAGRNYRNLRVLVLVALFATADAWFLYESFETGSADTARRAAIAVIIMLIMLMGGRVIPSFTRNWLAQRKIENLPIPFNRFDAVTMAVSGLAFALWIALPDTLWTSGLLIVAGALNLVRLARWKGWQAAPEQLVLVLHVAYAFIPLGQLALGLGIVVPEFVPPTGALHLLTAGAIGLMTLAMMTRVSLGHTGGVLHADFRIKAIYWALLSSVAGRFCYGYWPELLLLHLSATFWVVAFALFLFRYRYMVKSLNDPSIGVPAKP